MGFGENQTEANEHQNLMSEDKIEKYYFYLKMSFTGPWKIAFYYAGMLS